MVRYWNTVVWMMASRCVYKAKLVTKDLVPGSWLQFNIQIASAPPASTYKRFIPQGLHLDLWKADAVVEMSHFVVESFFNINLFILIGGSWILNVPKVFIYLFFILFFLFFQWYYLFLFCYKPYRTFFINLSLFCLLYI